MKKTPKTKTRNTMNDEMLPEYRFDYSKAKPNRFAPFMKSDLVVTVVLDPDVSQVFTTPEAVNHALRAIISAMPPARTARRSRKVTA